MNKIFVITASNPEARQHVEDTIENPIPKEKVEKHFDGEELDQVKKAGERYGYYAWGARPGPNNKIYWESMQTGDHILVYQNGMYTYYTKVVFKARNSDFALDNWGRHVSGDTWEYMYLLEKPIKLLPPVSADRLSVYLPIRYMGFARISDQRLSNMEKEYGSVEEYLNKVLPNIGAEPKLFPNFWWVCQGRSYTKDRGFKFIWAPKRRPGGKIPYHWGNMGKLRKGDIIFNYAHGFIQGVSVAKSSPYDYIYEGVKESENWDKDGIIVDIDHYRIEKIEISRLKARMDSIRAALGEILGPFDVNGGVKQGYLFEFTFDAAKIVREIYGKPFPEPIEKYFNIRETGEGPDIREGPDNRITSLLRSKKQMILYGPPGTGKTYLTKVIAVNFLNEVKDG